MLKHSLSSEGERSHAEMFLRSFHYFNFQINQALAFSTSALVRAIVALRRALGDFKEAVRGETVALPDNFLWGVLTFIKNILQVVLMRFSLS